MVVANPKQAIPRIEGVYPFEIYLRNVSEFWRAGTSCCPAVAGRVSKRKVLKAYQFDMHINDDHLYHGAALTQIAEYPTFKAINSFSMNGGEIAVGLHGQSRHTGVYLKYASATNGVGEYVFTFNLSNLAELEALQEQIPQAGIRGADLPKGQGDLRPDVGGTEIQIQTTREGKRGIGAELPASDHASVRKEFSCPRQLSRKEGDVHQAANDH